MVTATRGGGRGAKCFPKAIPSSCEISDRAAENSHFPREVKINVIKVVIEHFIDQFAEIRKCGSVVNNTLKSPGYPGVYPNDMDCNYSVPIPQDMAIKITFHEMMVESHPSCK